MTINNFFISTISGMYAVGSEGSHDGRYSNSHTGTFNKTYNASTGVLTLNYRVYSDCGGITVTTNVGVHCYLIVNPKIA